MIHSINKYITISIISILYGCNSFPYNGNIKDAYIFHWEHDYVVMGKFIEDHKNCLGIKEPNIGSQAGNIFNNMKPKTIPKWDSLWATFESRSYKEAGQRIAFSVPNEGAEGRNSYQQCMENLGYHLTYKR